MVMATGDAQAEVDSTELPEFVKSIQETVRLFNVYDMIYKSFFNVTSNYYYYYMILLVAYIYSGTKWMINMQ